MGAGSADKSLAGRLVYAMQVVEVLTFDEYMKDARFERNVPTDPGAVKRAYGDNIYRHGDDGAWLQADSRLSLADGNPTLGTSRSTPQLSRRRPHRTSVLLLRRRRTGSPDDSA